MKTLRSFAKLPLVFMASMLIAGPVSAIGVRDHQDRGQFDFSFPNNYGQLKNKAAGAVAHSDWPENLEDQINKHRGEHRSSASSIFDKYEDFFEAKESLRKDPLKFLFGTSGGTRHEDHFKRILENNPRYASHLVGFDGSEHDLRLLAKNIISRNQSAAASVVPIPAAAWLMLSALAALGWRAKKTRNEISLVDTD